MDVSKESILRKTCLLADDTTLLESLNCLEQSINYFTDFHKISGLTIR